MVSLCIDRQLLYLDHSLILDQSGMLKMGKNISINNMCTSGYYMIITPQCILKLFVHMAILFWIKIPKGF